MLLVFVLFSLWGGYRRSTEPLSQVRIDLWYGCPGPLVRYLLPLWTKNIPISFSHPPQSPPKKRPAVL